MGDENRCPQCGAPLAADAPQGLCPACLLKRGLETATLTSEHKTPPEAADVPPTPAELAPCFPDLEILEFLGRGGMGIVYKARQKKLDRIVALKILSREVGQNPAFAERFAREAQAMAMLSHAHIVTVHDFGQVEVASGRWSVASESQAVSESSPLPPGESRDDVPSSNPQSRIPKPSVLYYFIMEFVDGINLRRLLDSGKLAPPEALAIVPQICDALQYAHDAGVVHRDIKPENILLDKNGRVKIADFGLAKLVGRESKHPGNVLTGVGQVMGTPHYMAPEQIEHPEQVDHRADIYSLGVVFYQMLTGELPLGRFAPPSRKVHVDVRLDEVVLRALEKEPELRYQQASEVKTEVQSIVTTPDAADEAAGQVPPSSSVSKVSKCYLSTPEHLRSLRGRLLYIFKAKGELRLDDETLNFHSSWPAIVIPLSSIRRIGQGDFPYSAKPLPLEYIAVTYAEHGVERTVLLAPFAGALWPTTANENVKQWVSALQEAIRTRTGQTLPVERAWLTQDKLSTVRMLLLSAATLAGAIIVFTAILTLVNERRLPNANELLFGPVFAVVSTLLTFIALWERRRRAIAARNLDALSASSLLGAFPVGGVNHSPIQVANNAGGRHLDGNSATDRSHWWTTAAKRLIGVSTLLLAAIWTIMSHDIRSVLWSPSLDNLLRWDHFAAMATSLALVSIGVGILSLRRHNAVRVALSMAVVLLLLLSATLFVQLIGVASAGRHLLDLEHQASRDTGQPVTEAVVDVASHPGDPWIAPLPQGQIELVAISRHPSQGQPWWRPDGSPSGEGPFENRGNRCFPTERQHAYEFVIRAHGLPSHSSLPVWEFPGGGASATGESQKPSGEPEKGYYCVCACYPNSTRLAVVRVGIATEPWETIYESTSIQSFATMTGPRRGNTYWKVIFAEPIEKADGSLIFSGTYAKVDQQTRLVAIDDKGKEHAPARQSAPSVDNIVQFSATFQNLPLKKIKEFRFQARPYQWVEFRNVVLERTHDASGKGVAPKSPPQQPSK